MKLKAWISAFRLRTLPLALSCVVVGSGISWNQNKFSWIICILTMTTTILLQVLSNLANDYGDSAKGTDNDDRLGPTRAIQSGIIKPKQMMRGIIICSLLALGSGIWLLLVSLDLNWAFLGMLTVGLLGIVAAIKYTMGKTAYGYRGLGDLFVFLFFGIVGVMGSIYLQTKNFNSFDLIPAASVGFLSAGVLNLNNLRDYKNDAASNKNTLVVLIGFKSAKIYHLSITVLPVALLGAYSWLTQANPLTLFLIVPLAILIFAFIRIMKQTEEQKLDPELKRLALTTFLTSILFTISLCVIL
jgi:1,4-dihydroxy-2-naphthoate octaprenyltransferase